MHLKDAGSYRLHSVTYSQDLLLLSVPNICLEMGKSAFMYAAPAVWNLLQTDFGLRELVSLSVFKNRLKKLEEGTSGCMFGLSYLPYGIEDMMSLIFGILIL